MVQPPEIMLSRASHKILLNLTKYQGFQSNSFLVVKENFIVLYSQNLTFLLNRPGVRNYIFFFFYSGFTFYLDDDNFLGHFSSRTQKQTISYFHHHFYRTAKIFVSIFTFCELYGPRKVSMIARKSREYLARVDQVLYTIKRNEYKKI